MLSERTRTAKNFTCLHAGPMHEWGQFKMKRPEVPIPVKGKLFLRHLLGSAGMEISLNVVPPGDGIPFLHKHKLNEEVYVVVGGRGQFLVDGECICVEEGSVLRVGAAGERAYRNNSDAPLYFLCIQYRAASAIEGGTQDGQGVEAKLVWPE